MRREMRLGVSECLHVGLPPTLRGAAGVARASKGGQKLMAVQRKLKGALDPRQKGAFLRCPSERRLSLSSVEISQNVGHDLKGGQLAWVERNARFLDIADCCTKMALAEQMVGDRHSHALCFQREGLRELAQIWATGPVNGPPQLGHGGVVGLVVLVHDPGRISPLHLPSKHLDGHRGHRLILRNAGPALVDRSDHGVDLGDDGGSAAHLLLPHSRNVRQRVLHSRHVGM
mmetsp:Transcript_28864/g.93920  ORF Transcript_28864/g.93920 Transcript_28864/m.93920 type:complete len:230 (-) Transcript_28864:4-693(-)